MRKINYLNSHYCQTYSYTILTYIAYNRFIRSLHHQNDCLIWMKKSSYLNYNSKLPYAMT